MTKAPERIWAWPDDAGTDCHVVDNASFGGEPYVHNDHALALVAAAYKDAFSVAETRRKGAIDCNWPDGERQAALIAATIRARTPDDATAALERVKQEARNEALREIANLADKLGWHCAGCGRLCRDPEKDLELLRKAGARSCCPEREMEPLSAPILALITKGQSDG